MTTLKTVESRLSQLSKAQGLDLYKVMEEERNLSEDMMGIIGKLAKLAALANKSCRVSGNRTGDVRTVMFAPDDEEVFDYEMWFQQNLCEVGSRGFREGLVHGSVVKSVMRGHTAYVVKFGHFMAKGAKEGAQQ